MGCRVCRWFPTADGSAESAACRRTTTWVPMRTCTRSQGWPASTPETDTWQDLPDLPRPRSSHDAVVSGDHLYAVGGWQLRGAGNEPVWHDDAVVLDLSAADPVWKKIPQPFQRRALAVATAGGKIYAFGGLGTDGTSRQVDVYDPATDSWSQGPELPAMADKRMKGFGVSAFGVGDQIYLSGADGIVHRLPAGAGAWEEGLGQLETPRFFHRLLPHGERLLFVGGAARSGHLGDIEQIAMADLVPGSVKPPVAPDCESRRPRCLARISGPRR